MRQIEQSSLLSNAVLESIVAGEKENALLSNFSMTVAVNEYLAEERRP